MKNYGANLVRLITNNSKNYDDKYMKKKFNSDLKTYRTLELYNMIIVVKCVFYEGNKYYPQVFLNRYLYEIAATRGNVQLLLLS